MAEENKEKKIDEACGDRHVESVVRKFRERSRVGQAKYGHTLERGDLSLKDWLKHLQEELMDAVNYAEAAQEDPNAITTARQLIGRCKFVQTDRVYIDNVTEVVEFLVVDHQELLGESVILFVESETDGLISAGFVYGTPMDEVREELSSLSGGDDGLIIGCMPIDLPPE